MQSSLTKNNRPKSKLYKKLLFIGVPLVLLGIGIGFLPHFFSTPSGKKIVIDLLKKRLPAGELTIDTLSLSWKGPQEASGVTYKATEQKATFFCHTFKTDTSLWSLLFRRIHLGTFSIPLLGDTLVDMDLDADAPEMDVSLKGTVSHGMLTLEKPLDINLTMTPEVSRLFSKKGDPLPLSSVDPIKVKIDTQDVHFPLVPLDIKAIVIPRIDFNLGRMVWENQGNLSMAVGLLRLKQLSIEKNLNLWFAPSDASLKDGIFQCGRTEVLISNTYQVALWGQIDLLKDEVDMVLGLTAQCLGKAFGIKDLPKDYVMQIPLKGSLSNVKIDTKTAAKKIATLTIWQKKSLAGAFAGGIGGAVVGGVLDKMGMLPDGKTSAPPPKRPFPWEQ